MKCYSEKDGSKFQLCQKRLGYRTCFVQYGKGSRLILIQNTISNTLVKYVLNIIIFRPPKMKPYMLTINLIPICFQTAELSGEAAPQKSMILQLNRVYNKDHHPFFSPMFHVECENHVSGVKSEKFCYCSYHLCNYQKKISESIPLMLGLSLLVTALAS